MATKRRSAAEMKEYHLAQAKEWAAKEKAANKSGSKDLTKDSEGIAELVAAIEVVSKAHKIKTPEVIKQIARIKRTGLTITNAVRKAKA